jgi:fumarylacetoacetase
LVMQSDKEMVLPIMVGGYTNLFCSMHHTSNCGFIFRGP